MGLEAETELRVGGDVFRVKALLETREVIFRGEYRKTLTIAEIGTPTVTGDELHFVCGGVDYALILPPGVAAKWLKKLLTPSPSLAAKLGVSPERRAVVRGPLDDAELSAALAEARTYDVAEAALGVVIAFSEAELAQAVDDLSGLTLWIVHPKGRGASLGDSAVRAHMRGRGYVDTKTSAVSDRLTATRYSPVKS